MKSYILPFVLVVLILTSCSKEDQYIPGSENGEPLDNILRFESISSAEIPADSSSTLLITARIPANADSAYRNITFRATKGTFSNGDSIITVPVSAEGKATTELKSGTTAGNVIVYIGVKDLTRDTLIKFKTADPDDILLTAIPIITTVNDTIDLEATLYRNQGKVSDHIKVYFDVFPVDSANAMLQVPAFVFSVNEKARAKVLNAFSWTGRFNIRARTITTAGDTLTSTVLVKYQ